METISAATAGGGTECISGLPHLVALRSGAAYSRVKAASVRIRTSDQLRALIRSYTHKAQYIVVSHNDGVISEADILYGISMNEHGMSKVTTLKI